jgi:hypothetical protein
LHTDDNLRSPVEVEPKEIVYAASPLRIGHDGRHRYAEWDLFLLHDGGVPTRLSDFRLYQLERLSVANHRIFFWGAGHDPTNPVLPKAGPILEDKSETYAVILDRTDLKVRLPTRPLTPLFVIGGYSVSASVASDGKAAVLNTTYNRAKYRYDLVLVNVRGDIRRRIEVQGEAFSPAVFVGESLLFNELFASRYSLKRYDFAHDSVEEIASVNHSAESLRKLEQISLVIER